MGQDRRLSEGPCRNHRGHRRRQGAGERVLLHYQLWSVLFGNQHVTVQRGNMILRPATPCLITRRSLLRASLLAAPALVLPSRMRARSMHGTGGGGGYTPKLVGFDGAT